MSEKRKIEPRYSYSRRVRKSGLLGAHRVRMMLAMVFTLSLLLVIVHLPLYNALRPIGWRVVPPQEMMTLEQLGLEILSKAAPITPRILENDSGTITEDGIDEVSSDADIRQVATETEREPERRATNLEKLDARLAVREFAESMPEIVGGVGAYYINIEYPEAAARAGIEGRLMLDFIVEPSGETTDIRITKSLHPLCDSAAVRALRETRFIPGSHDGEKVRVRMRLPVRFELVNRSSAPLSESKN